MGFANSREVDGELVAAGSAEVVPSVPGGTAAGAGELLHAGNYSSDTSNSECERGLCVDGGRIEFLTSLNVAKDIAAVNEAEQFLAFDERHLVDVSGRQLCEHFW